VSKTNIALCRPGFAKTLATEFEARWGITSQVVHRAAVALPEGAKLPPLSDTVFVRQYLPLAIHVAGPDNDKALVAAVTKRLEVLAKRDTRPKKTPWIIHCFAIDDDPAIARAARLERALAPVVKKHFSLLAQKEAPEAAAHAPTSILQVFVGGAEDAWFSVAPGPGNPQSVVSPHIGGVQRMRAVPGAPSRSSSKLTEALEVLRQSAGIEPAAGETAVDLGAAPGGWTLVMALRGVDVTAVDHGALDLPPAKNLKGKVTHLKANGLKYLPDEPVDWLCCDMVMGARQSLDVLERWIVAQAMRRFVVNIKLPQAADDAWPAVASALQVLEGLRAGSSEKGIWRVLKARQLFHDRHEITLIGACEKA
jgi:23S rRNA (cytidine2498-2'-O)-methyltransferase